MNTTTHRQPDVGTGEDGARRSARIDREKADQLGWSDPRREELLDSADRWERQAYELMLDRVGPRPSLAQVRDAVGSEEWLTALALLELSPGVRADAAAFTRWSTSDGTYTYDGDGDDRVGTFHPDPRVAWDEWVADVDERGRGWSSTEWRLFQLVAGLTVQDRTLSLSTLQNLGSWETEALEILVQWASGGNNRDLAGRVHTI